MNVGACLERKHCCSNGQCFWEGNQRKIWNCNPQPQKMVSCYTFADPHMVGFNNNRFEAQNPGRFTLYSGRKLTVHYRSVKNGAWAAIKTVSINLDGAHFNFGVQFNQPFGKRTVNGNASITRNGNKITCSTGEGEEIDIVSQGYYLDLYVRTNKRNVGGLCANPNTATLNPNRVNCPKRQINEIWCRRNGGRSRKGFMKNCVFDLCQGLRRRQEIRIKREVRFEKHRKIHISKLWWNNRHHHHKHHRLFGRLIPNHIRRFASPNIIRRFASPGLIRNWEQPARKFEPVRHFEAPRVVRSWSPPPRRW